MDRNDLTRRDFQSLAVAALGGAVLGASLPRVSLAADEKQDEKSPLLGDPHVCRGLNTCKGLGKGKANACAGVGDCATAKTHSCAWDNDCKGQGGCAEHPGENACKHQGRGSVPLPRKAWPKVRKRFEELMTKSGKKFGPAPDAKK